jgi:CheY-like chemotaxis protein
MKVALLINDKALRLSLAESLTALGVTVTEWPTAAKAVDVVETTLFDLIVVHWKVHPGLNLRDPQLREISNLIPMVVLNRNVLYWESALRVFDLIRGEDSLNRATPIVVIFPGLSEHNAEDGDRLARESVDADLADRQPSAVISETSRDKIAALVAKHLPIAKC